MSRFEPTPTIVAIMDTFQANIMEASRYNTLFQMYREVIASIHCLDWVAFLLILSSHTKERGKL